MIINKILGIVALARDCERSLMNNIKKIERLRKYFEKSFVIVVENDSKDKTKIVLFEWENLAENIIILSQDFNTRTIPEKSINNPFPGYSKHRIEKLSMYRNIYMDYLQDNNMKADYMLEIDIDIDDFSIEGIVDSIEKAPPNWTALFANGVKYIHFFKNIPLYYYDGYPLIMDFDIDKGTSLTLKEIQEAKYKLSKCLKKKEYSECVSAFGGIGIYKYEYIKNERYYALLNMRSKIIESLNDHVSMNYSLYRKMPGSLYVARKMMVYYEKASSIKEWLIALLPFSLQMCFYRLLKGKEFPS
jgi:hypothetical protein